MDKVVIITSNIAPYRLLWFEELAKHFNVCVYYTQDREKDYDDKFLKHESGNCKVVKLNNPKDRLNPLCFDVIEAIRKNKDGFIIFDGYGPKTNLLGLLYCKIKRIKSFTNVDGFPTERNKSKIKESVRRFVINKLCVSFFVSGTVAKDVLLGYGVDGSNIVVHNFSSVTKDRIMNRPLSFDEKLKLRGKLSIDSTKRIVLGVGRFIPLKRFEDLIKAVKQCNTDCDLYLLGGKPTKEYLDLSKGTDRIHFIDFVLPEEVDKYYQMSDLFVLPSETDVWGLVINEAMANGLPIISSDSPCASKDLVKNNGIIYKTYDIDELSKAIDDCLESETNEKMSYESLRIIKEYTIEGIVERQLSTIEGYFKSKYVVR